MVHHHWPLTIVSDSISSIEHDCHALTKTKKNLQEKSQIQIRELIGFHASKPVAVDISWTVGMAGYLRLFYLAISPMIRKNPDWEERECLYTLQRPYLSCSSRQRWLPVTIASLPAESAWKTVPWPQGHLHRHSTIETIGPLGEGLQASWVSLLA